MTSYALSPLAAPFTEGDRERAPNHSFTRGFGCSRALRSSLDSGVAALRRVQNTLCRQAHL